MSWNPLWIRVFCLFVCFGWGLKLELSLWSCGMRIYMGHHVNEPLGDACLGTSSGEHKIKQPLDQALCCLHRQEYPLWWMFTVALRALNREEIAFPPDKFIFRICTNKFLTKMNTPTCHTVPAFSGLYVPLEGNLFTRPRMEGGPCQLLRLPPGWMKGNHKPKPVCFPKHNQCLINTRFKERQRTLHQPQIKTLSGMGGLTAMLFGEQRLHL